MSAFSNNGVTMKGAIIIASLVAGDTLTFTRIAVGDGVLPSGQTVLTTERLVNPLFNVPISSVTSDNAARATVKGAFNNANLATGFYYREIGLFAINPESGAEELFCYGNAGDLAEWINPVGESSLIEKEIHLVTLIGNATNVTANFTEDAKVLKSDFDAVMPLKADLDATPENGGRVLAEQMRFDASQTLYVDAAAAAGGDGSEAKPFKTIAEAINARYMGAAVIFIKIKPGTYAEELSVPRSPGTTWRITREGEGTVAINTAVIDNCAYVYLNGLTFNGPTPVNSTLVYVANVASFNLDHVTINGSSDATGVNFSTSRGVMRNCSINNCGLAIAATYGAMIDLQRTSGTGNTRALHSDGGVIVCDYYVPAATTSYERVNGGVISVQGGYATFPSNYAQLYPLGDFTSADALRAAILKVLGELGVGESRDCWFAHNIAEGFGPYDVAQRMQVKITKSTDYDAGYGTAFFKSHHNQPLSFMQIQNGDFAQSVPVAFAREEIATAASYGLLRVAAVEDEQNCQCEDAAVTPENLYRLSNFRRANVSYNVGTVVACPYHAEFLLKCTQAGRTSAAALDTTSVTNGQVLEDGGVKWEVIVLPIELGGTGAQTAIDVLKNLGLINADGKLSFSGFNVPLVVNEISANQYNAINVFQSSYSLEGGYGHILFYFGETKLVLQWAQFVIPAGTANESAPAYIPHPISVFFTGGVNCNALNGMVVEWYGEIDNMVTIYKGAEDKYERYGSFWVLGVAK